VPDCAIHAMIARPPDGAPLAQIDDMTGSDLQGYFTGDSHLNIRVCGNHVFHSF